MYKTAALRVCSQLYPIVIVFNYFCSLRGCILDGNAGKILSEILVNLQFLNQLELV